MTSARSDRCDAEMIALAHEVAVRGRETFPQVAISDEQVLAHLSSIDAEVPTDSLRTHAADLYVAAACVAGSTAAVAVLETGPLREIADFVARIDTAPDFVEEVAQLVRHKLFVQGAAGQRPKIADYSGLGPLGGWIRAVAVRIALDLQRARRPDDGEESDFAQIAANAVDPETAILRERYRDTFRAALERGLADLSPRERILLKFHFADGVTLDQLATSYQVHRATVARWLARAREQLLGRIKDRLADTLGLSGTEVESIVRVLGSQLDVSLSQIR